MRLVQQQSIRPGAGALPVSTDCIQSRRVQRLSSERMRVPHIGWNVVRPTKRDSLFDGLNSPHMYFVHSYHVSCEPDAAIAYTNHDQPFTSAFRAGNVVGVQFHPEKSSSAGERLLSNFLNA